MPIQCNISFRIIKKWGSLGVQGAVREQGKEGEGKAEKNFPLEQLQRIDYEEEYYTHDPFFTICGVIDELGS